MCAFGLQFRHTVSKRCVGLVTPTGSNWMRLPHRLNLLGPLLIAALGASCSSDPADPAVDARARFVNASPDSPPLDVLFDGLTVITGLESLRFTSYLIVNAGTPVLSMRPTGGTALVLETSATFVAGADYTVVAVGALASIEALVLTDDNSLPAPGTARLRSLHVAPSATSLDVYVTAPGADLAGVQPTFSGLTLKAVSAYSVVDAGEYQIRLTEAGTKTVVADAGNFTFAGREVHSLYILDAPGGGLPLGVAALTDASTGV
jgi:hypothetical protein